MIKRDGNQKKCFRLYRVFRDVVSSCIPFILQSKGVELMKWTKQAGLVSCDAEARLISKLNRELKTKRASKTAKKVKTYAKS